MDPKRIYQIFKSCRLCGADNGYKMPIYQNYVDLDDPELDLRQKVRECVQIEVYDGDRMPPLICGMCVDKIDEYYYFKELCKVNNSKTRKKLGLPAHSAFKGTPDTGDCILGSTEPYISVKKEPDETQTKIDQKKEKALIKKESTLKQKEIQLKNKQRELKTAEDSFKTKEASLKTLEQQLKTKEEELTALTSQIRIKEGELQLKELELKQKTKRETPDLEKTFKKEKEELKKMLYSRQKKEMYWKKKQADTQTKADAIIEQLKKEIDSLKSKDGLKRKKGLEIDEVDRSSRSSSISKLSKKCKRSPSANAGNDDNITLSQIQAKEKTSSAKKTKEKEVKPEPAATSRKDVKLTPPKPTTKPVTEADVTCPVCSSVFKNRKAISSHMRTHSVNFTNPKLACDACKLWFTNHEEVASHHRQHKSDGIPYKCDSCYMEFDCEKAYHGHFSKYDCIKTYVVPDVQCLECWLFFPTETLKSQHQCLGEDGRPGGKCGKCSRAIAAWKDLIIHEATCKPAPKELPQVDTDIDNIKADPDVLASLLPMTVRVAKCDSLLEMKKGCISVNQVKPDFGLDKNSVYPYSLHLRIKQEPKIPADHMVSINQDVKDEFDKDYVYWDSDYFDSEDEEIKIDDLSTLCLKVIFSKRMLGKVPRKKREVKAERTFDTFFRDQNNDFGIGIDSIIESLENDDTDEKNDESNETGDYKMGIGDDRNVNKEDDIKLLNTTIENSDKDDNIETQKGMANEAKSGSAMDIDTVENNESASVVLEKDSCSVDDIPSQEDSNVKNKLDNIESFGKVDSLVFHENSSTASVIKDNEKICEMEVNTCNDLENETNRFDLAIQNKYTNDSNNLSKSSDYTNLNDHTNESSQNVQTSSKTCAIDNSESNVEENKDKNKVNTKNDSDITDDKIEDSQSKEDKIYENQPKDDEIETNFANGSNSSNSNLENVEPNASVTETKSNNTDTKDDRNGSEMEDLMNDLRDLSGTDDNVQKKSTHKKADDDLENISDSELEDDRFMKELNTQIGESDISKKEMSIKLTTKKDKNDELSNVDRDEFEDLSEINKELEDRMDKDLDSISDEEFDFDA